MKRNTFRIISLLCVATIYSVFLNAYAWANTSKKPVVIRKKIVVDVLSEKNSVQTEIEAIGVKLGKQVAPVYDPKGKVDPFEPLFKETPEFKSGSPEYADTETEGTTELERIDLSQLKLTGIILAASGNRALVREASGRGYVIFEGTPIGTHGGRVAGVLKDKVIVKERMKDVRGRIFSQEMELKLNKPDS